LTLVRKKKIKVKAGDVFYIPLKEDLMGFGQVLSDRKGASYNKLYILFDYISHEILELDSIIRKPILAIGHLDDASLMFGNEWIIIGNTEAALNNIRYPNYLLQKTLFDDDGKISQTIMIVIDYEGRFLRHASNKDIEELNYPNSYTSGMFDRIIKAKYEGDFEKLNENEYYSRLLFNRSEWVNDIDDETVASRIDQNISEEDVDEDLDEEESSEEQIALYFKLSAEGFGTEEDIARKYEIEELLDSALRKNDLGDCDGGEIGNGEMIIFCYVNDLEKGIEVIKHELEKHGYLEGCKISTLSEMF